MHTDTCTVRTYMYMYMYVQGGDGEGALVEWRGNGWKLNPLLSSKHALHFS